jgi:hypothetical protein
VGFRLGRAVSQVYGSGFCLNDFLGNVGAVHFFGLSVQPSLRQFPSGNSEEGAGFSLRSGFVSAVQKDWSESTLNEPEHACRIIVGPALAAVPAWGWCGPSDGVPASGSLIQWEPAWGVER